MTGTMCGIILDNWRDCPNGVGPESPLNLCPDHLRAAADWYNRNDESIRARVVCEVCDQREGLPGVAGYHCAYCGFQSRDFEGHTRITPAELDPQHSTPISRQVTVVYYLRFGDRIKIGTSRDLRQRIAGIPHDEILALEPGGVDLERRRHAQFSDHRITGEWFAAAPALLEHVAALAHQDGWARQLRTLEGKSW